MHTESFPAQCLRQWCFVCRNEGAVGKTVTLAGPKAYTVDEVIGLCEKYAGADADVTQVCPLPQ